MSFLTVEDINSVLFNNQSHYWHEINTGLISESEDFTDVKIDFCNVSRSTSGSNITYAFEINNSYWTKGYYVLDKNGTYITPTVSLSTNTLIITTDKTSIRLFLYLGVNTYDTLTHSPGILRIDSMDLNYKQLSNKQVIRILILINNHEGILRDFVTMGYNLIHYHDNIFGFLLVNVIKSDFKFECTQQLIVGKVNKVALGTDSEYLPNGDMIGEYTPSIRVLYNDKTLPVTYDNTLNDYTFDLDLTEETTEHKIHLKVLIDGNEVLNSTSTDVTLSSSFETINTLDKLSHLFNVGGVGRLGSDLTLTDDLTVTKDVYLIGNEHTISMDGHKIIVPSDKIFKAEQTTFTNGENTIQQNEASKVELINCTFTDCTGLGSVIDCQIDVTSLDNPTDFTTTLNKCTLNNNDMCILHGGTLTVTDSTINGKISDDKYPYFLYQTDGEAHISGTIFNLTHNTPITTDIGYNSCIFTIGEQATINYGDHKEYSQNNVTGFLENSRNISIINVTYYYPPIEDYVTLQSTKGYCHSVSSVDFVFKTNVRLTRE